MIERVSSLSSSIVGSGSCIISIIRGIFEICETRGGFDICDGL